MMDFLQNMIIKTAAGTAAIAGDAILSGCVMDNNNYILEGFLMLGGEVVYFPGGYFMQNQKLKIQETKVSITVSGNTYPEVYVVREPVFAYDGEYDYWELHTEKRVVTNMALQSRLSALEEIVEEKAMPEAVGSLKVSYCLLEFVPPNWMPANGISLAVANYPELAQALGHSEDVVFNLPDIILTPPDGMSGTFIKVR
jgi:hypothetical protein